MLDSRFDRKGIELIVLQVKVIEPVDNTAS